MGGNFFPNAGQFTTAPSHSMNFALEGLVLFFILGFDSIKPNGQEGGWSGLFLLGYGAFSLHYVSNSANQSHISVLYHDFISHDGQILFLLPWFIGGLFDYLGLSE